MNLNLILITLLRTLVSAVAADLTHGPELDANITHFETRMWGGFLDGCRDVIFYLSNEDMDRPDGSNTVEPYIKSPMIGARCKDLNGKEGCTSIALGKCIGNSAGIMAPWDEGGFQSSCFHCSLTDQSILSCRCYRQYDVSTLTYPSELDLNDFIHNFNGVLKCHQSGGETGYCGPNKSYDPALG